MATAVKSFNTQPPEGGWTVPVFLLESNLEVSTHSRLKAAGFGAKPFVRRLAVSTHSRLKAAGDKTHTQTQQNLSFNTQPPEGGWLNVFRTITGRRVSTHSRLKAAGTGEANRCSIGKSFNTQPPEGGWISYEFTWVPPLEFQHTAA